MMRSSREWPGVARYVVIFAFMATGSLVCAHFGNADGRNVNGEDGRKFAHAGIPITLDEAISLARKTEDGTASADEVEQLRVRCRTVTTSLLVNSDSDPPEMRTLTGQCAKLDDHKIRLRESRRRKDGRHGGFGDEPSGALTDLGAAQSSGALDLAADDAQSVPSACERIPNGEQRALCALNRALNRAIHLRKELSGLCGASEKVSVQGKMSKKADPQGKGSEQVEGVGNGECRRDDFEFSKETLHALNTQLVPVSGGSTAFTLLDSFQSALVNCYKPSDKNSDRCKKFFDDNKWFPWGGKIQATSSKDLWMKGRGCANPTEATMACRGKFIATGQSSQQHQYAEEWTLLHYSSATAMRTAVEGIQVKEMVDFAMLQTPEQLRAYVLTEANLLYYIVNRTSLHATKVSSHTIPRLISSTWKRPGALPAGCTEATCDIRDVGTLAVSDRQALVLSHDLQGYPLSSNGEPDVARVHVYATDLQCNTGSRNVEGGYQFTCGQITMSSTDPQHAFMALPDGKVLELNLETKELKTIAEFSLKIFSDMSGIALEEIDMANTTQRRLFVAGKTPARCGDPRYCTSHQILEFPLEAEQEEPIRIETQWNLTKSAHVSILGNLNQLTQFNSWNVRLTCLDGQLFSGVRQMGRLATAASCGTGQQGSGYCLTTKVWHTGKVLPCAAVNEIIARNMVWKRPMTAPGVYWESPKQTLRLKVSATAAERNQDWAFTVYKSLWPIECNSSQACYMSKTVACSYPGIDSTRQQCCTQKKLETAVALTDQGLVSFKLGETSTPSDLLGSSADLGLHTAQGWRWPTGDSGFSAVMPRIMGVDQLVAGQSTPYPGAMDSEDLGYLAGACVTSGFNVRLGTVHPGGNKDHSSRSMPDSFRSGGVSTVERTNSLDVWVADLPYCLFPKADKGDYSITKFWSEACLKACGDTGNSTRILRIDAHTSEVSEVIANDTGAYLDVAAAVDKDDPSITRLAILHLNTTVIDATYPVAVPHGPTQEKILRPGTCTDEPGCTCDQGSFSKFNHECPGECGNRYADGCPAEKGTGQKWDCWKQWGGSPKTWYQQRGFRNWPYSGNVTTALCVDSPCSCCFHNCPSYTIQFATANDAVNEVVMGGTFKISSSCVIPSLSADKEKVYVLTSRAFQMHSHTGAVLFSWTSPKLEYQGFMEPSPNFLDSPINQNGKFRQQWRGRFGGQIALDNRYNSGTILLAIHTCNP